MRSDDYETPAAPELREQASAPQTPDPSSQHSAASAEGEAEPTAGPSGPNFRSLGLPEPLLEALTQLGYEAPSRIQEQTIPPLLQGRDLLGQAQTGTGKTAAFALPILARLDLSRCQPQALVLVPTRELAIQVAEAFQRYASKLPGFHVLPIYGGQAYPLQLRPLERGVHVVVGTPGRVLDHLERGSLQLAGLSTFVLDEADEMLRMGFVDDVEAILSRAPEERQVALFSATLPDRIREIGDKSLRDPVVIRIQTNATTSARTTQRYRVVPGAAKLDALTRLLEVEPCDGMIVFVRTKTATVELADRLEARGHAVAPLSGDVPQRQREHTIDRFRRGTLDILVATDVAARGLDVDRVSHVVNFDMPHDVESYVHRIGRTGRAGREGHAILFVAPRERRMLKQLERAVSRPLELLELPTDREIDEHRTERFKERIAETVEEQELAQFSELVRQLVADRQLDPVDVAAACAFLAQEDRPLQFAPERGPSAARELRGEPPAQGPGEARGELAEAPARRGERSDEGLRPYRVALGFLDRFKPGHLVGALINEGGLMREDIGRIDIRDRFTVVALRESSVETQRDLLAEVQVLGRELQLEAFDGELPAAPPQDRGFHGRPQRPYDGGGRGGGRGGYGGPRREFQPGRGGNGAGGGYGGGGHGGGSYGGGYRGPGSGPPRYSRAGAGDGGFDRGARAGDRGPGAQEFRPQGSGPREERGGFDGPRRDDRAFDGPRREPRGFDGGPRGGYGGPRGGYGGSRGGFGGPPRGGFGGYRGARRDFDRGGPPRRDRDGGSGVPGGFDRSERPDRPDRPRSGSSFDRRQPGFRDRR